MVVLVQWIEGRGHGAYVREREREQELMVNAVLARWRVFRSSSLYVCLFHG